MSSKGFGKRLGFKRSNTDKDPVTVSEQSNEPHGESSSSGGDVPDISEAEANRRLNAFRLDHQWDPNLPDEAIEMVDAVTGAHDQKGESQLVGDMIENSPYPEVS